MNIKITHSWLLDYLDTDATPLEIQKYLSLCGPSIERIEEVNGEIVYDIEITSNRIDTASVLGIAREAAAILPLFGKKAVLKKKTYSTPETPSSSIQYPISITDPSVVCRRLLGIVLEIGGIATAPDYMSKRLVATDSRSLNNVVDVTNYVMTEMGHPSHVFDYDRIGTHTLILRNAKKGEEIITLDEKKFHLDVMDIVIDDGTGKVIDLPGIMGTANSVVTSGTKRILFFIESNNPVCIRRTSMKYGIRTMASTINEKGPDSNLAYTAFLRGIELFQEVAGARIVSKLIDIYPKKQSTTTIQTSKTFIDERVGTPISIEKIVSILTNLEFVVDVKNNDSLCITVPTHRVLDVSIPEDIVEEVARVYGYFAIPSVLQQPAYVIQPKDTELQFHYQYALKNFLKHKGSSEVMNYSAVSKELLDQFSIDENNTLYITNSISEDIKYLRTSLIPSLVKNIKQNEGFEPQLKLFELAKTYIPTNSLPQEENMLGIITNVSLDELKKILIGVMRELNISYDFKNGNSVLLFMPAVAGQITNGSTIFGSFGQLKPAFCRNMKLDKPIYAAELSFKNLISYARKMPDYKSFSAFAQITNDITVKKTKSFAEMQSGAFLDSKKLISFNLLSTYKDTVTVRLEFTDFKKNLSEDEVKIEIEKILTHV